MKYSNSSKTILILASTLLFASLQALDLTPFYRTAAFQAIPKTDHRNGTSFIKARYFEGNTKSAWDCHERLTSLFTSRGLFDLTKLGVNQNRLLGSAIDNPTKMAQPLTHKFLRDITRDSSGTITDGGEFTVLSEKGLGKFNFIGNFSTKELQLEFQQNLMYGFYLQGHLPLRDNKIDCINFFHISQTEPSATDMTATNQRTDKVVFDDFVANLDNILKEHQLLPVKTPFCSNGLSDAVVAAGWQGYDNSSFDLVSSVQGFLQLGLLMPFGDKPTSNQVFWVPDGYEDQWGVDARFAVQANALEYVGIGVHGGITIFLNETHCRRVRTSCTQRGWINLIHTDATKEQGDLWNLGVYLKGDHILGGLSILGGYLYTKQERSYLTIKDCDFLKEFVNTSIKEDPPVVISRDHIASSDERLDGWNHHTLHVVLNYDFGIHVDKVIVPQLSFEYSASLMGQSSWKADVLGGNFQLIFSWMI